MIEKQSTYIIIRWFRRRTQIFPHNLWKSQFEQTKDKHFQLTCKPLCCRASFEFRWPCSSFNIYCYRETIPFRNTVTVI